MPDMSVLMVCRNTRGGMKQHILSLAKGLAENGMDVTIAGPRLDTPVSPPFKTVTLPIPENPLTPAGVYSLNKLTDLIKKNKYGIVHTHGYVAGIIGRIAAARAGNALMVHSVHNFFPVFSPITLYGIKGIEVWLSRYTARIIAVSEHLRKDLVKIGIPAEKISTIYNGVDPTMFNPADRQYVRESLGFPPYSFVIGTVARLIPAKGVDLFIEALALVKKNNPSIKGVIVGDGPEALKLQTLARSLGIAGGIRFLGYRNDVPKLLSAFDLFVLSSRQEGFGISVLEAQYSGLPVIASAAGGIPEIVRHGVDGLLFPAGDYSALADRISFLLEKPDYRHTLALEGKRKVKESYTSDRMIQSTLQLYSGLNKLRH